jgi:hypothetical protein
MYDKSDSGRAHQGGGAAEGHGGSEDEWWANAVTGYHKNIANPESDEHRENMLSGYPTKKLLLDIIDPNQDPPGSNEHQVSI